MYWGREDEELLFLDRWRRPYASQADILGIQRRISRTRSTPGRGMPVGPVTEPCIATVLKSADRAANGHVVATTIVVTLETWNRGFRGHRVRRRQSDPHAPSLSAALGPGRCSTDLVTVIAAAIAPDEEGLPFAIPLTIRA
jgi:hypothetical protein